MTLNPQETAQVADLDKQLRERGRRDFLLAFLIAVSLILSTGAVILGLTRANRHADAAQTKARTSERRVVKLERRVLPIQRVLVRKDILRAGPRGLTGGRGPLGRTGATGRAITGPLGPIGPEGPFGAIGPAGPPGVDGAPGQDGPQGEPGATGEQGIQGEPGAQGDTGATGPPVQSFTFSFLGVDYVCTDPEQDGSYACQPSP